MQSQDNTQAQPSSLERRIDMAVPMAAIQREVEQRLRHLSKTVKMAGFRPGKVPMNLVTRHYGAQAHNEAVGAAVERAFGEQVRQGNYRVAGYPRIEPKPAGAEGHMEFSAVFEVYPEFQPSDLAGKSLTRATLTVGDGEVDKTIEVLRKQRISYAPAGRPSQKEDRMVVDFTGRKDGEEFAGGKASDYQVMVGGGMMLPDFEAAMEGISEGETRHFDVTFPEDYHAKDLAGQTVQFELTCKQVEAPQLPALDEEFARALGVADGDLVKMRQEVQDNLEREVKKRLQSRVKNQVMDILVDANPIEVPKALVQMESEQMAQNARRDLEARGMMAKNVPVDASWFTDQATRRVRLGLIVAELVKVQNLQAKPEQVRAVVDDFAQTFEDPKEVVRWYYSQPERLAEAEALALEANVVDWALAHTQVTDEAIAFDDLMGNNSGS